MRRRSAHSGNLGWARIVSLQGRCQSLEWLCHCPERFLKSLFRARARFQHCRALMAGAPPDLARVRDALGADADSDDADMRGARSDEEEEEPVHATLWAAEVMAPAEARLYDNYAEVVEWIPGKCGDRSAALHAWEMEG